ncbi:hypothetical protein CGMCC3_g11101 [Colletotrichum fructicola]|nr:uncharacterized protein CGMCC3_g11101 [Colletotrichum fructicola]KAE9572887.1 hypothetical protein CGMCC3_g11101 [Colletotrichum fructicola]
MRLMADTGVGAKPAGRVESERRDERGCRLIGQWHCSEFFKTYCIAAALQRRVPSATERLVQVPALKYRSHTELI